MRSFAKNLRFAPKIMGFAFGMGLLCQMKSMSSRIHLQAPSAPEQTESQNKGLSRSQVNLEEYSAERVLEVVSQGKENVILVINQDMFKDSFKKDIMDLLEAAQMVQNAVSGKPIRFFNVKAQTPEELAAFKSSTGLDVSDGFESILVLHNTYTNKFQKFSIEDMMYSKESLFKYFQEISLIGPDSLAGFSQNLSLLTSDQIILIGFIDKNDPKQQELKGNFSSLMFNKDVMGNKNVFFMLIEDEETAKHFGISEKNSISIFLKDSKMNLVTPNLKFGQNSALSGKVVSLLDEPSQYQEKITEWVEKNRVFATQTFNRQTIRYAIEVSVNKNKITKADYNRLLRILKTTKTTLNTKNPKLAERVSLALKRTNGAPFEITAVDVNANVSKAVIHNSKEKEEVERFSKQFPGIDILPYVYKFNTEEVNFGSDELLGFIEQVSEGKAPHFFKSQPAPKYQRHSRKLVGKIFTKEIMESPLDQVIFYFSKHCHACKFYGPIYEKLALEYLRNKESSIEFNRMDNDLNNQEHFENFNYTPNFVVVKKEAKKSPLIYRSQHFTPKLLQGFVEASNQVGILDKRIRDNLEKQWSINDETIKWMKEAKVI